MQWQWEVLSGYHVNISVLGLHHGYISQTDLAGPPTCLCSLEGEAQLISDPRLFSNKYLQEPLDLADPKLVQAIWKPEVFFPNAKEGDFQFVTMPNLLIRIHPDGEILYILRYEER